MRSYLLTGEYYTPPDRGSPNGHWYPFEWKVNAESDSAAVAKVREYLEARYSYSTAGSDAPRKLKLISFEEVDLAPIFG